MAINVIYNQFDYEINQRKKEVWDKYNEIIQWGRMHPLRFAEIFLGLEFTDHQKYVFMSTWCAKEIVWVMSRNSGKAASLDTPVYSVISDRGDKYPKKTIGDLKVGDKIYDENGKLTEVIHLNPIIFEEIFEVEFEDGEIIECNGEHLWQVYDFTSYKHLPRIALREHKKIIETNKIFNNVRMKNKSNFRYAIPIHQPIEYFSKSYIIEPYLLFLWIGDGKKRQNRITCDAKDIDEQIRILQKINSQGWIFEKHMRAETYGDIIIKHPNDVYSKNGKLTRSEFTKRLKQLELYNNKHIPTEYLYGSVKDRIDMISGIMDSDGTVNKQGKCQFTQKDKQISEDILKMLLSLGIKASLRQRVRYDKRTNKTYTGYTVLFMGSKEKPVFKLNRKYTNLLEQLPFKSTYKAIVDVRKTNRKKPMRCITVSNDSGLFLCGNKATVTHNSYLSAPYIMTRSMLIPDHSTYIMSVTGNQSQETFSKMEDLALGKIASVAGSTRVFVNEVIKQNSAQSGFVHDKNSYSCELFNGATIKTLNSVPKNIVGIRSNLNLYDEAGKIDREFFALTKPFTAQNTDFITGKGINARCIPRQFPTQNILCSSAEDIFTELWNSYRLGAMEMMMGNKDYFVCDLDCRFSLHPKKNGKPMTPLVSKQVVDNAIAQNEFRANREYFNKFDLAGGQDCLVNKMTLVRNSRGYMPVFEYEEGKRYIIVNDPSSKVDNSIVLVAELFRDEEKGWMAKIVNCRNLIEKGKGGNKIILQKPQQIEIIKQMIVDYNGPHPDYVNLERIIIDAGSGGGGFDIAAWLMPGWVDSENQRHIGVIDLKDKYCKEREDTFKSAKDILTLANFTRDKVKMYENTSDALNQGLVIFPKDSNGRGEMEFENKDGEGNTVIEKVKMSQKQLSAIIEIEMLKYELTAMEKSKNTTTGRISFDLMASRKSENLHDDRADCVAMLCDYLMDLRAQEKLSGFKQEKADYSKLLTGRKKHNNGRFGGANPFANLGANPFL